LSLLDSALWTLGSGLDGSVAVERELGLFVLLGRFLFGHGQEKFF
jgi:hypothetical protein